MRGLLGIALLPACATILVAQEPQPFPAPKNAPPIVTPGRTNSDPPSDAIVLFDGKDLSRWRSADGGPAKWLVRDGYVEVAPGTGEIATADKFGDVQLHIEWATPAVVKGEGPVAKERMQARVKAWEDGAWVRDAARVHAEKRAAARLAAKRCAPCGPWRRPWRETVRHRSGRNLRRRAGGSDRRVPWGPAPRSRRRSSGAWPPSSGPPPAAGCGPRWR